MALLFRPSTTPLENSFLALSRLLPPHVELVSTDTAARLALAAVTVLLIVWLVVRTWRTRPAHPAQRRTAAVVGLAFLAEMAIGLIMQTSGSTMLLLMAYVAAGTLLYAALVVLAALIGLADE